MNKSLFGIIIMAASIAVSVPAHAQQPSPLSPQQLANCASQVQQLRSEAVRLNQQAAAHDSRRDELARLRDAARTSTEILISYNQQATAFNSEMVAFREDMDRINEVKRAYDQGCANRSYRRSDLAALPQDKANAMRTGLADVRVPHTNAANVPLQQQ